MAKSGKSWLSNVLFADYISAQGAVGIKQYKYQCENTSVWYKYGSGPLAAWLVDHTPRWVAPNVLTLIGFFFVLCAYGLVWFWCPTFTEQAPAWVWLTVAGLLFSYRTLDNMDGKQARRLGCGSPLGLSLDHGCDAVTTCLVPAIGCAFLQTGQTVWTVLMIVAAPIGAFVLTWEEFYTGVFKLGSFNGVDEGGLITDLVFLVGGLAGPARLTAFTNQMVVPEYGLRMRHMWVIGMWVLVLSTVAPAVVNVIRTEKWKKAMFFELRDDMSPRSVEGERPWEARHYKGKTPRVRDAFGAMLPVLLGSMLWLSSVYFPFRQSGVLLEHSRTVIWLAVMLFSKLITHLHVAHVCGDPYYQWRKTYLVPVALITINSLYSDYVSADGSTIVDEITLLSVCTAMATMSWLHMAYSVVTGMCRALDIPFLTVPARCLVESKPPTAVKPAAAKPRASRKAASPEPVKTRKAAKSPEPAKTRAAASRKRSTSVTRRTTRSSAK